LPLLRFTRTYHALVSTVAADAGAAATAAAAPPTTSAVAATANLDSQLRRRGAPRGTRPMESMILLC
jgi:hypothetical protein